ncbi:hypothetical protein HYT51_02520 [Candidatus Woesearchaeota archaeon]|nr:hypothetical protein [Candidatus Woesearchaeota archaeon]
MLKRLEERLKTSEEITLDELKQYVPDESVMQLEKIHKLLGNIKETTLAVLVSFLYQPQSQALTLLCTNIPKIDRRFVFTEDFYYGLKSAYQKRVLNGIPHSTNFLLAEIDTQEKYTRFSGKVGPGPYPMPRAQDKARK